MPERIQQKRTKGWRKPAGAVSVARPSKWGNPYKVVKDGRFIGSPLYRVERLRHPDWPATSTFLGGEHDYDHAVAQAVGMFSRYIRNSPTKLAEVQELRGKDLMCFCPLSQPCHADVLLELANREEVDVGAD